MLHVLIRLSVYRQIHMNRLLTQFIILLSLSIISMPSAGIAQDKIVYPHSVFWSKTEVNEIFKNNIGVGLDYVHRRKNELGTGTMFDKPLRNSFRPWIHYQFGLYARLSVSPIGYMNTTEYVGKPEDYQRAPYHEYRTTFQFFHHQKQLNNKIMHTWRYRYELRWQEVPGTSDYRYFNRFRFRYRIRYVITGNDFYKNKTMYAAISNEIGLNMGKSINYHFNQNRLYAGIGYRFLNTMRVELRYVNRYRTRGGTGFEYDNGTGMMIGLYVDQISGIGKQHIQRVKYTD